MSRAVVSYGIWVEPTGDNAITDEPGFLTNCGRDLSFETAEAAAHDIEMIRDERGGVRLSVRQKHGPERTLAILTKNEAKRYRSRPQRLDTSFPGFGLSMVSARCLIAALASEQERIDRRVGEPGRVRPTHLRGAALYARWLHRFGEPVDDAALDHAAEQSLIAAE